MDAITLDERRATGRLAEVLSLHRPTPYASELAWIAKVLDFQDALPRVPIPAGVGMYAFKEDLFDFLSWILLRRRAVFPDVCASLLKPCFTKSSLGSDRTADERRVLAEKLRYSLNRYLSVLGFEARLERDREGVEGIRVKVLPAEFIEGRREDHTRLHSTLERLCPAAYVALVGAFEQYMDDSDDAPRQAIDSCRNACENLFKYLSGKEKWGESLEEILGGESAERLARSVYAFLSGTGTHSPKPRTQEDAIFSIRLTEDLLRTALVRAGRW
jgi:hypothetical protein